MKTAGYRVEDLDPYLFMGVLGKRVIHPGGKRSTEELLALGDFSPAQRVVDVGCGVGTTAISIAKRFGAHVTAVDISPLMVERAEANVGAAGLSDLVDVMEGDILALDFADGSFDRVLAEAVTMFVDRARAVSELVRVCRPGGIVLSTEFLWRRAPSEKARRSFLVELCPGMTFDTLDDWLRLYEAAGLTDIEVRSGSFEMMTPKGFLADEGVANSLAIIGRTLTHPSYMRKMAWMMPRIAKAVPYLGYVVIKGAKPR